MLNVFGTVPCNPVNSFVIGKIRMETIHTIQLKDETIHPDEQVF